MLSFGREPWDELRTRDELAALSDAISAVEIGRDIGDDSVKAGHYERAMDVYDKAEAVMGRRRRKLDLGRAQALIEEARRELNSALGSAGVETGGTFASGPGSITFSSSTRLPNAISGLGSAADGLGLASELLGRVLKDPQGFREQLKAQAGGSSTFVVMSGGQAPTVGAPAGQQSNVADMLAKLADLRDRGALTPEEFEAQKKKLLGD